MIATSRSRLVWLAALAPLLVSLSPATPRDAAHAQVAPTHRITWDAHSLMIDGQRILLYSGEFHYWRLPSPSQWEDRLEKMKAAGLNAVSIYFDWQYHSSAPGQYDFTGVRDIDRLLSMTDRLGLYVIARVGPYMNGEADAGGLPGWLLTKQIFPRSQTWDGVQAHPDYSPLFIQYSKEWYDHLLPILARHQVTNGGSVLLLSIENEYSQTDGSDQYMRDLYSFARNDGITVPIFHNDFWFRGDWSKLVDLYAYDSYPYGFSCCHQWWDQHFHGIDTWEKTLRSTLKVTTPMFVSELQGGSFDPWGGKGYDAIAATLGPDWLTDIDESALAQGTDILNTYMFAGGTSWGYMSEPGVYTSYDYGAPIAESGALRPAYYAAHRLAMFVQSYGPALAGANAAPAAVTASNPKVMVHVRVDPRSGQIFAFLRHGDPGPTLTTTLTLRVNGNAVQIPQVDGSPISVPGHAAQLLTANVDVGPIHMNYSTSQVLTDAATPDGHYLVLYGPGGATGETDLAVPSAIVNHNLGVRVTRKSGQLILDYSYTDSPRTISVSTASGTIRLIVTTTDAASRYWVNGGLLIGGADLVTGTGSTLRVSNNEAHDVVAYGVPAQSALTIDGLTAGQPDAYMGSVPVGHLSGAPTISLPALTQWKFQTASPETSPTFDDRAWTPADHTSTGNPNVDPSSTLLADDYGFNYGFVWYRGHFTATGQENGITLAARQSYSVFLNGQYLGGGDASLADPPHSYAASRLFRFPPSLLRPGQDNVIAVLTESLGHDEGWIAGPVAQSPQGVLSAQLDGVPTSIAWRIQGAAGGEVPTDAERGLLNASGLYGEREGWYLPDFNDSSWDSVAVPDHWSARGVSAAVGWYRAHFTVNLPSGAQAPIGLTLPHVSDKAVIWLNGWLLGRYWEQRGPQHEFYLPDGILNSHGDNVLSIAVWNRGHDGGLTAAPRLDAYPGLQQHALSIASSPSPTNADYWQTEGNRIVDSSGRPVRIAAVNWFGMENHYFVPAGLDHQPLDAILEQVKRLGFNTIRLPFSNQLVEQNPIVQAHLQANPSLRGLHALDLMDRIVAAAGAHGLRIILDDGRSNAGTQPQENGLWYTARYPESSWIQDWQTLVTRYSGNPTVVGVDLRNEPHTGPPGPWSVKTYLTQGATWGPYNGVDNPATDWRLAAERGGDAVLALNPHLLVFVEGIQQYPDKTQPGGVDSYWWGGVLQPARQYPVELSVPHQLVYSPHEYGPLKYQMRFFGKGMTYASMKAVWEQHWNFLEQRSFPQQAPIFIGEFGTCGTAPSCISDSAPGSQGLWFSFLMEYLRQHPQIGWSFWALNGTNHVGADCPQYILKRSWNGVRLHQLTDVLRDLEAAPPPGR